MEGPWKRPLAVDRAGIPDQRHSPSLLLC
jgi:hypothetical protein